MTTLREELRTRLSEKEHGFLRTGLDILGEIAIIEIPKELTKKEKIIAQAVLKLNTQVKTVAKKVGIHKGVYRTQKLKVIAGKNTKETTAKESGVVMKLNVEKCYFSPRLSNERLRIAGMVKNGEKILVMFSGVAPYNLVIAKNALPEIVYGVELNPIAHKYAVENASINRLGHKITLVKGDVRKVVPKIKQKFDRIIMPLPKTGEKFLSVAFKSSKKGTIIHYYDFLPEDRFKEVHEELTNACSKSKKKCKILRIVKCGQHAPGVFRICVDLKVI